MPRVLDLPTNGWALRADAKTVSGSQPFAAIMSLALRNPDGSDPVVLNVGPSGEQAFLLAQATTPFVFDSGNVVDGIGGVALALDDDPASHGLVLLGQIIVLGNNNEIGVTDVTCTVFNSSAASQQGFAAGAQSENGLAAGFNGFASTPLPGEWLSSLMVEGSSASSGESAYQLARERFLEGN